MPVDGEVDGGEQRHHRQHPQQIGPDVAALAREDEERDRRQPNDHGQGGDPGAITTSAAAAPPTKSPSRNRRGMSLRSFSGKCGMSGMISGCAAGKPRSSANTAGAAIIATAAG